MSRARSTFCRRERRRERNGRGHEPFTIIAVCIQCHGGVAGRACLGSEPAQARSPAEPSGREGGSAARASAPRGLSTALIYKPWKGDFDAMVQRRLTRIVVPYGRTLYFNDKGQEKGITADLVRDFERYINTKYRKDKRPITVVIIPTTRDKLLSRSGRGSATSRPATSP
jgi:hypothetical protein